jgi:hypothetical protein
MDDCHLDYIKKIPLENTYAYLPGIPENLSCIWEVGYQLQ